MNKIFSTLFAILIAATCASANSTRDAQFYLNSPEKYEGKKITLYVAYVRRMAATEDDAFVIYSAYTMDRDEEQTSFIDVLVPKGKADSFARRYGGDFKWQGAYKIRKLSMSGTLEQIKDIWYLKIAE
jgi:hypothetical protein